MANEKARHLRKTMTSQEVKLWVHLRGWRQRGYHFRRQSPRKGFIVDFVCMKQRLVIEVDGGQHNFSREHDRDAIRDAQFKADGFRILRFWNSDVDRNLSGVLEAIDAVLQEPHPAGVAGHPPPCGGGISAPAAVHHDPAENPP
jgi:very-short-patch-repair endonuclease